MKPHAFKGHAGAVCACLTRTSWDCHVEGCGGPASDPIHTVPEPATHPLMPTITVTIENPCPKCGGSGVRVYSSTATWRGGIGGQAMTEGICDSCWGSRTTDRTGADLRKVNGWIRAVEKERDTALRERDAAQQETRRLRATLWCIVRGQPNNELFIDPAAALDYDEGILEETEVAGSRFVRLRWLRKEPRS